MIAAGAALTIATGGAIAPLLVALGVTGGAIQLGTSIYRASKATTDDEAIQAWQGMGAGTSAVGLSVLGSKAALKGAGVDTKGMGFLRATVECFKQVPSSVSKSVGAFTSGEALTNLKNVFKPKKSANPESEPKNNAENNAENKVKSETESKPETKAESKPEQSAEQAKEPASEPKAEPRPEVKPSIKVEELTAEKITKMSDSKFIDLRESIQNGELDLKSLSSDVQEAISRRDFKFTCDYGEKYCKLNIGEGTSIESHHDVYAYAYEIRNELNQTGQSAMADAIDKQFATLEPLEKDCVTYRGRGAFYESQLGNDFSVIENANIGDTITPDVGYSYTSRKYSYAERYSHGLLKGMLQEIRIPQGAKVSRNLEHGGEILMPRGVQYRLISKDVSDDFIYAILEYILPN